MSHGNGCEARIAHGLPCWCEVHATLTKPLTRYDHVYASEASAALAGEPGDSVERVPAANGYPDVGTSGPFVPRFFWYVRRP